MFQYGMDTNVGNAFVYGDLKAVDTVTYPEISGEYMYVEKVKERYTKHTRRVAHGFKTSCGCNAKRYFKPKQSTDIEKRNTAISRIIGRYKSKAKTRNIKWDISKKTFISTIEKPCFYCGIQSSMSLNINGFNYNYNGVDRIDSSKDYTNDNIVPCCKNCNMAKSDLKQKDFYDWVQRISENFTYDKVIKE